MSPASVTDSPVPCGISRQALQVVSWLHFSCSIVEFVGDPVVLQKVTSSCSPLLWLCSPVSVHRYFGASQQAGEAA